MTARRARINELGVYVLFLLAFTVPVVSAALLLSISHSGPPLGPVGLLMLAACVVTLFLACNFAATPKSGRTGRMLAVMGAALVCTASLAAAGISQIGRVRADFERAYSLIPVGVSFTGQLPDGRRISGILSRKDLVCLTLSDTSLAVWQTTVPAGEVISEEQTQQRPTRLSVAPETDRAVRRLPQETAVSRTCDGPLLNTIILNPHG